MELLLTGLMIKMLIYRQDPIICTVFGLVLGNCVLATGQKTKIQMT